MTDFDNKLYNDVIKLYNQDFTYKQISDKLNIPIDTVKLIIIKEYY